MKKFTALFLTVMMVFALAAGAAPTAHAANPIHLKLSHPAAEGAHYDLMSKEFKRLVEEKSGGKYVIDIFAANALGTQEEVLDAVSLGTLDFAVTSDDILAKYAPDWGYLGMPYLFDDVDDVDENLNGELGKYLSDQLEVKGIKIVSFFENGFRNVTAKKPVNVPEDLAGIKIRVLSNEPLRAMFTKAGAVITNVTFSELYQALQLGTLDLWDSLSAEDQEMFMEAGLEASKWAYQYSKDTDAENRAYLETVMTVIDVDRNVWKAFAEETNAPFMEKYTEVAKLKK